MASPPPSPESGPADSAAGPPPRRVLALDLGRARIGVALSDLLGIGGTPLVPLPRVGPRKDVAAIRRLVDEHDVGTVVVGLPLMLSGQDGPGAVEAREFSARLAAGFGAQVRVELWDERLSTVEAERTLIAADVRRSKRKSVIDGMAAALILRGYLDGLASGDGSL